MRTHTRARVASPLWPPFVGRSQTGAQTTGTLAHAHVLFYMISDPLQTFCKMLVKNLFTL